MTNLKTNIFFATATFFNSAILGAAETDACIPGDVDSVDSCNGAASCVDVKTKQHCDENGKAYKKYFVEGNVESVTIEDDGFEQVLMTGSDKWKFQVIFFDPKNTDVTEKLILSKNLIDQCNASECAWVFRGGGLNSSKQNIRYKYTITKHKTANHDVKPLDPSIIVKPQK